jgi:hypothetical protein
MSDLWQRLAQKKGLDASLRLEIEETFGTRGKKALAALDSGKIKNTWIFLSLKAGLPNMWWMKISVPVAIFFTVAGRAGTCWQSG